MMHKHETNTHVGTSRSFTPCDSILCDFFQYIFKVTNRKRAWDTNICLNPTVLTQCVHEFSSQQLLYYFFT